MKMKTFKVQVFWVSLLLLCLVPVWSGYGAEAQKVYKARLSYHWGPGHHASLMANLWAKMINEETGGRLQIQVFPHGQLYSIRDIIPAVSSGAVEFGGVILTSLAASEPNMYIEAMAFTYKDVNHVRRLWTEMDAGKRLWAKAEEKLNFKRVAWNPNGPVVYWNTKKLMRKLEDYAGMDSRYLGKLELPYCKVLGMQCVSISTEEVYTALERKMINILLTNPSGFSAQGWWDYCKFTSLPWMYYQDGFISANADFMKSLPQDLRDKVMEIGDRLGVIATDGVMKHSEGVLEEFVKKHNGTVYKMPQAEVDRIQQYMMKNGAYNEIKKAVHPDLWEAMLQITKK
jgi:TRAP-type C4-dicarboxylate transport system substrate-binding protein